MATDEDTRSSEPTPRTNRALTILRLVTLACAAVMAFSPNSYDRMNALNLAVIALVRPQT
jgi:hypothetical protein